MDPLDSVPREPPAGCDMSAQNVNKPHVDEVANTTVGGSLHTPEISNFTTHASTDINRAMEAFENAQPDQYQNGGGICFRSSTDPLSTLPMLPDSSVSPVVRTQAGAGFEDFLSSSTEQFVRSQYEGLHGGESHVKATVTHSSEYTGIREYEPATIGPEHLAQYQASFGHDGRNMHHQPTEYSSSLPQQQSQCMEKIEGNANQPTSASNMDTKTESNLKNLPLSTYTKNSMDKVTTQVQETVEDVSEDDNCSENTEPLGKDDLPPEEMDACDDSHADSAEEGLKAEAEEEKGGDKMEGTNEEDELTEDEAVIDEKPSTYIDEQLCKQVMKNMKELRECGLFCDTMITLQTGEEFDEPIQYLAHRCVLAANSSRFQSQFKNTKAVFEEITMTSENAKAFEALLDYLYTGELKVTMSTIDELLFLAKQLNLDEVVNFCDTHLQRAIDVSNWVDIFHIASSYNLEDTTKYVEQFGVSKFMTVVQDESILELPDTMIEPILRRCNPRRNLTAELLCLQLVINWTIHQYEERSDRLAELLGILRKKTIPLEALETILNADEVMNHPIYSHPATVEFSKDISNMKLKVLEAKKAKEEEEKKKKELQEREKGLKKSKKNLRQRLREQRLKKRELERLAVKIKSEVVEPEETNEMEKGDWGKKTAVNEYEADNETSEIDSKKDAIKLEDRMSEGHMAGGEEGARLIESADKLPEESHYMETRHSTRDERLGIETHEAGEHLCPPGGSKREAEMSEAEALDEKHSKIDAAIIATEAELKDVDQMLSSYGAVMDEESDIDNGDNDYDSDWEPPMLEEDEIKIEGGRSHKKGHRRKSYRPTRVLKGTYNVSPMYSDEEASSGRGGMDEGERGLKKDRSRKGRGRPRMMVRLKRKPLKTLRKTKGQQLAGKPRGRPKKTLAPGESPSIKGRVKVKHKCTMEGCKYSSWRKCDLEDHINSHTGNRPHLCTVCNKGFISRKHLRRHKYIHLEGKLQKCTYCDYSTVRRDKVKEHMRIHHTAIAVELGLMKEEDVGKMPPRKRRHTNPDRPRKKEISTVTIGDDGRITMATQTLSGEESPEHEVEETYEDGFPKGPLLLPAKKRRKRTKAVPSGTGEGLVWKCDRCDKEFDSSSALNHHRRGHGAENPYLCEVCGFSTVHYASMRMHKKIHRGETHKCTFEGCSFETIHKSRLEDHLNKHNGIKNHVCSVCGKAFGAKKHMQRHEKLHADIKPISCDYCDYRTTRRDKLRDHIKIHHQDIAIIMGLLHPDDLQKPKSPRARKPRTKKPKKEPVNPPNESAAQAVVTQAGATQAGATQAGAVRAAPVGIAPAPPTEEPTAIATVIGPIMTHIPPQQDNEDEMAVDTITVASTPESREVISRDPHVQPALITMPMPAHLVGMTTISEEMVHYLTTMGNPQAQHQHHPHQHLLLPNHHTTGHILPGQQAHPAHNSHPGQQHQPPVTSYHDFYTTQTTLADNVYR